MSVDNLARLRAHAVEPTSGPSLAPTVRILEEMLRDTLGHDDVRFADELFDRMVERMQKSATPLYSAQIELAKALVTLASASLVFSISVIQFLAPRLGHPHLGILLPASWILFGLTVLAGALSYPWAGKAHSLPVYIESARGELRAAAIQSQDADKPVEYFLVELERIVRELSAKPLRAIRLHDVLSAVMYWSYAAGLGCLLTFAIRNLPF